MKVGWEGKWNWFVVGERVGGGAVSVQEDQPALKASMSLCGIRDVIGGGGAAAGRKAGFARAGFLPFGGFALREVPTSSS